MRFKNLEGKPVRETQKRTKSASGGLESLQMVSEPDTGRCTSEKTKPRRGVGTSGVPVRMLGDSKEGGLGGFHIDWRME